MINHDRPLTSFYLEACMRKTFEDRVAKYGEYPEQLTSAPMPEGFRKALEAQKLAQQSKCKY